MVALIGPGCEWLGGQTGEAASSQGSGGAPPCSNARPVGYEQTTTQGYSPAELMERLGGTHEASIADDSIAFWEALAVADAPAAPVPLTIQVEYSDGAVVENECDRLVLIDVVVTLVLGDGLLQRSAVATLEGDLQDATLSATLVPPVGGDASAEVVTLDALLLADGISGTLAAGTDATPPTASFAGARP